MLAAARHADTHAERLTTDDVDSYLARPHLSQNSRAAYYLHLSSWFDYLLEEGVIDVHPLAKRRRTRPRRKKGIPRPLTDGEVDIALETSPDLLRPLMLLALHQGLRVAEAVAVRGEHFRGDQQEILGKGDKVRLVPIHPDIQLMRSEMPQVGLWVPSPRRPGRPLSKEFVSTHVGLHFRDCGIPFGSLHRLRHTYATRLHRLGVSTRTIQVLLGHASVATTEVYAQVDWDDLLHAVALLPRAGGPGAAPARPELSGSELAELLRGA